MNSAKPILEVNNLEKKYEDVTAVNGVSFRVHEGEIVGLLGPNGAGKTTTIDMILGLVEPTSGSIRVFGKDLGIHRQEIMEQVNFCAIYAPLQGNLTIWENLYIYALLYNVTSPKARVDEVIHEFGLDAFRLTRTGLLSSGEQSKANMAKAMLNEPRLFLLDEPTASIDPSTSEIIRSKIKQYAHESKSAVVWTSHDMREIEEVCDRVLFISHGKILLEGDPRELPKQYGKGDLEELFITIAREPLSLEAL